MSGSAADPADYVSTLDYAPGFVITDRRSVESVISVNPWALRDFLSGIGDWIGAKRRTVWANDTREAVVWLKEDLARKGIEMGAERIINAKFVPTPVKGEKVVIWTATGEAVSLSPAKK